MAFEKVYFALGSNIEPRSRHLEEAIRRMSESFGSQPEAISQTYDNPAVGFSGRDFLNCAVRYSLDRDPFEVLKACKDIEKSMGRDIEVRYDTDGRRIYTDRVIDIDIIYYGDRVIDTPSLTVPHPRAVSRPFVQIPLRGIMEND